MRGRSLTTWGCKPGKILCCWQRPSPFCASVEAVPTSTASAPIVASLDIAWAALATAEVVSLMVPVQKCPAFLSPTALTGNTKKTIPLGRTTDQPQQGLARRRDAAKALHLRSGPGDRDTPEKGRDNRQPFRQRRSMGVANRRSKQLVCHSRPDSPAADALSCG